MPSTSKNKAEILKALVQDYASARQEVILHIQLYKTQERYGTVIVGVLGLLIPVLTSAATEQVWKNLKIGPEAILLGLFTVSTIFFHMYFSTLANLFALQVLAERCVFLQDQINKLLNGKYLLWERLTKLIWSKNGIPVHKMPDHVAGILSFFLVSVFAVFLPICVVWRILSTPQSALITGVATFYIWYLFAAGILAVVHFVAVANIRADCHQLFKTALDTRQLFKTALYPPRLTVVWSNIKALVLISTAAMTATVFLLFAVNYL